MRVIKVGSPTVNAGDDVECCIKTVRAGAVVKWACCVGELYLFFHDRMQLVTADLCGLVVHGFSLEERIK